MSPRGQSQWSMAVPSSGAGHVLEESLLLAQGLQLQHPGSTVQWGVGEVKIASPQMLILIETACDLPL